MGQEPIAIHQPRRSDAIANRQRLIAAARDAFAELGPAAEVKDIAERAGVGVGTVYRHFSNKDDLLHAVINDAAADLDAALEETEAIEPPIEALRRYLTVLLTALERDGWLLEPGFGGMLQETIIERGSKTAAERTLRAILQRGVDAGVLRKDLEPALPASLLLGATVVWRFGPWREQITADAMVDSVLNLFLEGARARPDS